MEKKPQEENKSLPTAAEILMKRFPYAPSLDWYIPIMECMEEYRNLSNDDERLQISGSLLLHDLMQVGAIKNEDGMPVIKYVDKPNGGSVAYVRHDAMVNKLNNLLELNTKK